MSAVSAVRKNSPDVVVLDIALPGGDAFPFADHLQNLAGSATTPITSSPQTKIPPYARASKLNGSTFLQEPFAFARLADTIASVLSQADVS